MTIILIYVTNKNGDEAKKIANHLLNKKLIACANFFPISSLYLWKGNINNENEIVSLFKTKEENWEKVKEEIKKLHPYDTPCILKINGEANEDYEKWINDEVD